MGIHHLNLLRMVTLTGINNYKYMLLIIFSIMIIVINNIKMKINKCCSQYNYKSSYY